MIESGEPDHFAGTSCGVFRPPWLLRNMHCEWSASQWRAARPQLLGTGQHGQTSAALQNPDDAIDALLQSPQTMCSLSSSAHSYISVKSGNSPMVVVAGKCPPQRAAQCPRPSTRPRMSDTCATRPRSRVAPTCGHPRRNYASDAAAASMCIQTILVPRSQRHPYTQPRIHMLGRHDAAASCA